MKILFDSTGALTQSSQIYSVNDGFIDTTSGTASNNDLLAGKIAYSQGNVLTGTITTLSTGEETLTTEGATVSIGPGYLPSAKTVKSTYGTVIASDLLISASALNEEQLTVAITNDGTNKYLSSTPIRSTISATNLKAENIKKDTTILGITGTYDPSTPSDKPITLGTTMPSDFSGNYNVAFTLDTDAIQSGYIVKDKTILGITGTYGTTPETKSISLGTTMPSNFSGNYDVSFSLSGDITADKIAKGSTILGVVGTYTTEDTAPAAAGSILEGKVAYVNGVKLTGTIPVYDGSVDEDL